MELQSLADSDAGTEIDRTESTGTVSGFGVVCLKLIIGDGAVPRSA